jgi:hypothetical protein
MLTLPENEFFSLQEFIDYFRYNRKLEKNGMGKKGKSIPKHDI